LRFDKELKWRRRLSLKKEAERLFSVFPDQRRTVDYKRQDKSSLVLSFKKEPFLFLVYGHSAEILPGTPACPPHASRRTGREMFRKSERVGCPD
jgi:hypothetical protein